jgi:hypothetical protein
VQVLTAVPMRLSPSMVFELISGRPGLVCFDEVEETLFISDARAKTLHVKVWDAIFYEITLTLPAISTLIIVAGVLVSLHCCFSANEGVMLLTTLQGGEQ